MKIQLQLIKCKLKIKRILTETELKQENEIKEWLNSEKYKTKKKNPTHSVSPRKSMIDNNELIKIHWCITCKENKLFINKKKYSHSVCETCGNTTKIKSILTRKIGKALYPDRGKNQRDRCK